MYTNSVNGRRSNIFYSQLGKGTLHTEAIRRVPEGLKNRFRKIAKEEEWHVKVAQEILEYLKAQQVLNQ